MSTESPHLLPTGNTSPSLLILKVLLSLIGLNAAPSTLYTAWLILEKGEGYIYQLPQWSQSVFQPHEVSELNPQQGTGMPPLLQDWLGQ